MGPFLMQHLPSNPLIYSVRSILYVASPAYEEKCLLEKYHARKSTNFFARQDRPTLLLCFFQMSDAGNELSFEELLERHRQHQQQQQVVQKQLNGDREPSREGEQTGGSSKHRNNGDTEQRR